MTFAELQRIDELRRLCLAAGLTETEMLDHPEHGLLILPSGLDRVAEIAPEHADDAREIAVRAARRALREVFGTD